MCIRDSYYGFNGIQSQGDNHPLVNHGTQVSSVLGAKGNNPVSYTHLRAHETVLDLVCRLLLEKKNTLYQYIHSTS